MRLLLVEDDRMIGIAIQRALTHEGFAVDWAKDGSMADIALTHQRYELAILDLGLPVKDGLTLLEGWRQSGNRIPVLIVTARDTVKERVRGLDTGADDYLVKPFDLDELLARVRALLRRNEGRAEPEIRVGPLCMHPTTHEVSLNDTPISLSAREFSLLQTLLQCPGKPLSKAEIEARLYAWGEEIESNAVEVHIHSLRRKIGAEWIRNLRGVGYFVPRQ